MTPCLLAVCCRTGRRGLTTLLALLALLGLAQPAMAQHPGLDYGLSPRQIAPGVYVLIGRSEDFSTTNGGNIVNTGFIIGSEGVIVVDSGPSLHYGEQLRQAIAAITPLPIVLVLNTHHHPDHFLGNQAFPVSTLAALAKTRRAIESEGGTFLDNMYRLCGAWMSDTTTVLPERTLEAGMLSIGGRRLQLFVLSGHTEADLAVLDVATGTLFAADLAFFQRAPTTPHADIGSWLQALEQLERIPFQRLVPGHGPVSEDGAPIAQTRDYLRWLEQTVREGAEQGMDMTEMLAVPVPKRFSTLAEVATEYRRSVIHLYPAAERAALKGP